MDNSIPNPGVLFKIMQFISLRAFLDKQLPSMFRLRVQNFFSFLPFVPSFRKEILELRALVNQSKSDKRNYSYCEYYKHNLSYFSSAFLKENNFSYSIEELAYLKQLNKQNSFKNIKENLPPVSVSQDEDNLINNSKLLNSYLVQVESFLKKDDFQEKIENLLKALENKELHIKLAKELISQARAKPYQPKLTQSALIIIDKLNFEQEQLVSQVFDDLKNDQALDNYYFYLIHKAETYKSTLFDLIDDLGSSKASKEPCLYKLQREFLQMKHPLNQLCDNGVIQEKEEAIDSFINHFNLWRDEHQAKLTTTALPDLQVKNLLQQITQCIEKIKGYIKILNESTFKKKYYQDQVADIKMRKLYYDRKEFEEDLEYNRIDKISEQRLYELYPNNNDFIKQLQKCKQQGIEVFDARELKHQEESGFSKASMLSI